MKPYVNVFIWVVVGLLIGYVAYVVISPSTAPPHPATNQSDLSNKSINQIVDQKKEINITLIDATGCTDCASAELFLQQTNDFIKTNSSFLKVGSSKTIQSTSDEAKTLIAKYQIQELPALVISGPSSLDSNFVNVWTTNVGSLESDGALISRNLYPPYFDLQKQAVVGLANIIIINAPDCSQCLDGEAFASSLEDPSIDMKFSSKKVLGANDSQAKSLITAYNITKLPALLLNNASAYPVFSEYIVQLGDMQGEWFVLRNISLPYFDIPSNHTLGLVKAIYIVNTSCTDCFDINSLSDYVAQSSGIALSENVTYDINSTQGMELVKKYNITTIPTLIYSHDASLYENFDSVWLNQTNTIESDGSLVFRAHQLLNVPYQNISG